MNLEEREKEEKCAIPDIVAQHLFIWDGYNTYCGSKV